MPGVSNVTATTLLRSENFDVIVAGLGAMGGAAAAHLAERGLSVLGLDRFTPPHELGSSHGESRIIRAAYFEDPVYVPLVRRAFELWEKLQADSASRLLRRCGVLMLGRPEEELIAGSGRTAQMHEIPHQMLTPGEIVSRFPGLQPPHEAVGLLEPQAGVLFPEPCVKSHLELAGHRGARLVFGEPVRSWKHVGDSIEVTTDRSTYRAAYLVLAIGAWTGELLAELDLPLTVERQVLVWFEPAERRNFQPERFPVFIWEHERGRFLYGFPDLGRGVKAARHHEGELTQPDQVRRSVEPHEVEAVRSLLQRLAPEAAGRQLRVAVCLYTNTPDSHFLIDFHPACSRVLLLSPCSGHGFKFSPVIGEIAADLITGKKPRFELGRFALARFRTGA